MPAPRRRYTKREKAEAVATATMTSTAAAAEKLGIPETTLAYWMKSQDFVELRAKTSEDVADTMWVTMQVGVRRIAELIPQTDDIAKVGVAVGILYDKRALMTGGATDRTESRDITDRLDDHEAQLLGDAIRAELARRTDEQTAEPAVAHPGEAGAEST